MRQANAALTALLNGQKKALQFTTASANYVSVPNASSLNPSGSFALGFWFRVLADVLGYALHLASKAGPADGTATFVVYHFGSTSGTDRQLIVYGGSGGVWNKISGTFNLTIGTLYHLFFTFNPATGGQLYINGQPIGVRTAPGAIGNNTNILQVGAWGTAPDQAMIDEFRYYVGRDFSATEVTEHYQGIFRNESGLVGYWPFDEGTGTTAFDLSGKGNNGTLVNAPVYVDFNPYPGTERQFRIADLLTITLVNGITLRYTSADIDITSGGNLFSSKGPQFTRGKTKMVVGIVVDEMDLSIFPQPTDLISGQPFMQAVTLGAFDGATVTVERAFMPAWGNVSAGTLVMFSGRMAPVESTRTEAKFKVQSDLELLNIQMPRNIYQPGCMHTLYDTGCSLVKTNFAVPGTVTSGSTASMINASAMTTTSGEFDLGTIEFQTGALAGIRRTVKSYTPGAFNVIQPLPSVPQVGDTFNAYPGCDKQQSTCGANVGIVYTVDSTTDIFTATAHGLVNDRAVKLSTTGTFPGAAVALDAVTAYFVVNATANTFQLSRTIGGPAIDITSNGTGTNKVAQVGKFANIINFRGTPFVPVPETMI